MSRSGGVEIVEVKPGNNSYTALAAAGLVATIVGFVILYLRAQELFGGLF